jgi:hypothetical protein
VLLACFFFAVVAAGDFFFDFLPAPSAAARDRVEVWVFAECWLPARCLADARTAARDAVLDVRFFRASVLPVCRFRG